MVKQVKTTDYQRKAKHLRLK